MRRKGLLRGEIAAVRRSSIVEPYREIINRWLAQDDANIMECKAVIEANKLNQIMSSKHGANDTGTMREGISLPVGLLRALEKYDPDLFSDTEKGKSKRALFKRDYPQFKRYKN